jgi:NAD(P)-dependent dehydrogenase (short-subunit alcohol dehydrogenase family)
MSDQDPRTKQPEPPFPAVVDEPPGSETGMRPAPDFGEASYVGHDRLRGRAAIVTGGDSGIGRAVALAFAREGADVVISYLEEEQQDAEITRRAVESAGRSAVLVAGDIQDEAHCRSIVDAAVDAFGRLDVLVNNAACQVVRSDLESTPSAEIERTFRTNILSMFWLCKAALPRMQAGATIVNSTSIQAFDPSPQLLAYATTKAAIANFTRSLAKQVISRGIRVNAVAPGPVWTPLITSTFDPEGVAAFGEDDPMGRPAQPAELAPAYVFLASDDSRFVVGEVLAVTGGLIAT